MSPFSPQNTFSSFPILAQKEITMSEITFVLSQHLSPPFNPYLLQILCFLSMLRPHAAVPVGFSLPIIRIILQKDGQWSGEPIHVSTLSGPRIPEQFCFQIHSGTFNVLLLGLQRKLKTFFPPLFPRRRQEILSDIVQGGLGCGCHNVPTSK